jgi:hypothetical protein
MRRVIFAALFEMGRFYYAVTQDVALGLLAGESYVCLADNPEPCFPSFHSSCLRCCGACIIGAHVDRFALPSGIAQV